MADQRLVCVGAGSAGMGVVSMIAAGMMKERGLGHEEAVSRVWIVDHKGLITKARWVIHPLNRPVTVLNPHDPS